MDGSNILQEMARTEIIELKPRSFIPDLCPLCPFCPKIQS